MEIGFDYQARRLTVSPAGELDHHAARSTMAAISDKIDTYLPDECVLDFSHLSFMDSSGIAVILKTYKRMNQLGGVTWVENVKSQPMKVLTTSGIGKLVKISY